MSTLTTKYLREMIKAAQPSICDCSFSYNGIGQTGRECDCFMGRFDVSPEMVASMAEEILASREREDLYKACEATSSRLIKLLKLEITALRKEREQTVKAAALAEREACAKLADDYLRASGALRLYVSAAIRARQENGT